MRVSSPEEASEAVSKAEQEAHDKGFATGLVIRFLVCGSPEALLVDRGKGWVQVILRDADGMFDATSFVARAIGWKWSNKTGYAKIEEWGTFFSGLLQHELEALCKRHDAATRVNVTSI